jgi:hypothetical protein
MENERWSWFAGGLVLGLILGLGIAAGVIWPQLQAERARGMEAAEEARMQADLARQNEAEARRAADELRQQADQARQNLQNENDLLNEARKQADEERTRILKAREEAAKEKKDR